MQPQLDKSRIALGIKQPWAELIVLGHKTIEVRSQPTRIRGPIYIYTSQKLAREDFAQAAIKQFQLQPEDLVTGMIIGTVNLIDCRPAVPADAEAACVPSQLLNDAYAWILAEPELLAHPQPVQYLPYGVWFYPYQRRNANL